MTDSPYKPGRRWFQFRLSTVAILFFLFAVGLSVYRRYVAYQALDVITQKAQFVRPMPRATGLRRLFDDSIYDVHHLSFHGIPVVTNEDVLHVTKLSGLRRLSLHRTSVDDGATKAVGALRNLEAVSFERTGITDAGLANLRNLQKLKVLGLGSTAVTNAGMKHVAELASLEELRLHGVNTVTATGIAHLKKLQNLRLLVVDRPDEAMLRGIGQLTSLEELEVRGLHPARDLAGLAPLKNLRSISIRGQTSDPSFWQRFERLEQLSILGTSGTIQIRDHSRLKKITINRHNTIRKQLAPIVLEGLPNLTDLQVLQARRQPAAVQVDDCPQLSVVRLYGGTTTLGELAQLKELSVTGHGDKTSLIVERPLPALEQLSVRHIQLPELTAVNLSQSKRLRMIQQESVHGAHMKLSGLAKLSQLYLSNARYVGSELSRLQGAPLEVLILDSVGLTDEDLELIEWPPSLIQLNVANNQISDEGLRHFHGLHELTGLSMQGNSLTGRNLRPLLALPKIRHILLGLQSRAYDRRSLSVRPTRGSMIPKSWPDFDSQFDTAELESLPFSKRTWSGAARVLEADVLLTVGNQSLHFRRDDVAAVRKIASQAGDPVD